MSKTKPYRVGLHLTCSDGQLQFGPEVSQTLSIGCAGPDLTTARNSLRTLVGRVRHRSMYQGIDAALMDRDRVSFCMSVDSICRALDKLTLLNTKLIDSADNDFRWTLLLIPGDSHAPTTPA